LFVPGKCDLCGEGGVRVVLIVQVSFYDDFTNLSEVRFVKKKN
jgi:hypothetical protein